MSDETRVDRIEQACKVMHDAYEAAAQGFGWDTQQASRKPWADVPEANKATMRASVKALLAWIEGMDTLAHLALLSAPHRVASCGCLIDADGRVIVRHDAPAPHPQGGTEAAEDTTAAVIHRACHWQDPQPCCVPQGGIEALRGAVETWRARLLASTTFWVDDLAAHDVARQLTNLLDSEDCPHLSESGDEGPVVDLPGGWPVRWRCDGCDRIRYDDAALADLRALLAAAPAPTEAGEGE